jgi:hypothetical protein
MVIEHPAGTSSRQVPEDMRMYRYRHGYVVTTCQDKASAERAAQALVDAGFQREELVLISHDVDALDAGWPGEDSLEVFDPASVSHLTIEVASGVTFGTAGALLGVMSAYFVGVTAAGTWLWVLTGCALGGVLGALLGRLGHRLFGRRPARFYDTQLSGEQVLVGIGLRDRRDDAARARAREVLQKLGHSVIDLPQ